MAGVFIGGGTGYLGTWLVAELLRRGHGVCALARPGSERKLPAGCTVVTGNALEGASYRDRIAPANTFVQLTGVSHPSPAKVAQFLTIDLASVREAVSAAASAGISHFIYVSVAHPAPAMRAYIAAREQGEAAVRASGMNATILRPWYVLGPGHWWPVVLLPAYWIAGLLPQTREGARRLGLVTLSQMIAALSNAVDNPPLGLRVFEVPEIRHARTPIRPRTPSGPR